MDEREKHTLEEAVLSLARTNRDWAAVRNDVGFNKFDSEFGMSLAEQIAAGRKLSQKQIVSGLRMIAKYRQQLWSIHGIDLDKVRQDAERRLTNGAPDTRRGSERGTHYFEVLDDEQIQLVSPFYRQDLVMAIKGLPSHMRRWDGASRTWRFPVNTETVVEVERIAHACGIELRGKEKLAEFRERLAEVVEGSHAIDFDGEFPLSAPVGKDFLPFQQAGIMHGIKMLRSHGSVLIGDEMGLGKTVQAIGIARMLGTEALPALFVVPNVVKRSWLNHVNEWWKSLDHPDLKVRVVNGGKANPEAVQHADVVILNYDILAKWAPSLKTREWGLLVLDEMHYAKNPKALRTKQLAGYKDRRTNTWVEGVKDRARFRIGLTGTIVLNRVTEVIEPLAILGWIGKRGPLGSKRSFLLTYGGGQKPFGGFEGTTDPDLLAGLNRLMRTCGYIRRTKRGYVDPEGNRHPGVMEELPPILPQVVPLELRDRAEYDRFANDLYAHIEFKLENDADFAAMLTALDPAERERARQRYVATGVARAEKAKRLALYEAAKQAACREKLNSLFTWVHEWLEESEGKLLLFAHHQDVAKALAAEFGAPMLIGGMSDRERQAAEEQFQPDPSTRILILGIAVGSVGLPLTAATDVAIVELPWRPGDVQQAAGRAYGRVSDAHGINLWYLVAADTVEEKIAALLDTKSMVTSAVNTGTAAPEDDSIMDLLTQALIEERSRRAGA